MDSLLAWQNLIFYIPLVIGLLMAIGSALGVTEMPQGVDLDGDGEPDAWIDGDHEAASGDGLKPFELLGFGKVPMLLVIMVMALVFGGAGTIYNLTIGTHTPVGAILVAFVATVTCTGIFSRVLAKMLPTLETTSMLRSDLVGSIGTMIIACDEKHGLAQVRKNGDLHQIQCKAPEPIAKGQPIIVTDYDAKTDSYDVCLDPTK